MKIKYLILLVWIINCTLSAQLSEMRVVGTPKEEPAELVSKEIHDANGEVCAGLIIKTDLIGLSYQSNNGIVKINRKPGEDFLFLSPEERVVTIYCSGYVPLQIIINTEGIKLKSGQAWSLKVSGSKSVNQIPINILIKPSDATIVIDSTKKVTGSTTMLNTGSHSIRIEKEGYKSIDTVVNVTTMNTLFSFTLSEVELQEVRISTVPMGAKIFLNGSERGETNKGLFMYAGKYSLQLIKPGFIEIKSEIEIKENIKNNFSFPLLKSTGTLSISMVPSDAKILINKEDYSGKNEIELSPGKYKIEIEKENYESFSEAIAIKAEERMEKKYSLKPKMGELQFTVEPPDAKCTLLRNGTIVQNWSGLKILKQLQLGSYEIRISANGYHNQTKSILIQENKSTSLDIRLIKEINTLMVETNEGKNEVVNNDLNIESDEQIAINEGQWSYRENTLVSTGFFTSQSVAFDGLSNPASLTQWSHIIPSIVTANITSQLDHIDYVRDSLSTHSKENDFVLLSTNCLLPFKLFNRKVVLAPSIQKINFFHVKNGTSINTNDDELRYSKVSIDAGIELSQILSIGLGFTYFTGHRYIQYDHLTNANASYTNERDYSGYSLILGSAVNVLQDLRMESFLRLPFTGKVIGKSTGKSYSYDEATYEINEPLILGLGISKIMDKKFLVSAFIHYSFVANKHIVSSFVKNGIPSKNDIPINPLEKNVYEIGLFGKYNIVFEGSILALKGGYVFGPTTLVNYDRVKVNNVVTSNSYGEMSQNQVFDGGVEYNNGNVGLEIFYNLQLKGFNVTENAAPYWYNSTRYQVIGGVLKYFF